MEAPDDRDLRNRALTRIGTDWKVNVSVNDRFPFVVIHRDGAVIAFAYHWLWEFGSEDLESVMVPITVWTHLRGMAEKVQLPFMILSQHHTKGSDTLLWRKFPPATGMGYKIEYDEGVGYPYVAIPKEDFKVIDL